ncbi:hypothetical protein [Streptomyces sp. NPDC005955]|uniref:hypothetical protein n=1 Tax=Streptomyces sp. NPDC005955 TaxID=3364738 RepID=UPI0036BB0F30
MSDAGGATDGGHSVLGRMADDLERMHLRHATVLLDRAGELIADQRADRRELRFLADQLRTSLREVTRIADSRGARLTAASGSDGTERTARDA